MFDEWCDQKLLKGGDTVVWYDLFWNMLCHRRASFFKPKAFWYGIELAQWNLVCAFSSRSIQGATILDIDAFKDQQIGDWNIDPKFNVWPPENWPQRIGDPTEYSSNGSVTLWNFDPMGYWPAEYSSHGSVTPWNIDPRNIHPTDRWPFVNLTKWFFFQKWFQSTRSNRRVWGARAPQVWSRLC